MIWHDLNCDVWANSIWTPRAPKSPQRGIYSTRASDEQVPVHCSIWHTVLKHDDLHRRRIHWYWPIWGEVVHEHSTILSKAKNFSVINRMMSAA
jgi:hypothetical protein